MFEELAENIAYLMTMEKGYDWGCDSFADCLEKAKEMIRKDDDFLIGYCMGLRFVLLPETEGFKTATKILEMIQHCKYAGDNTMVRRAKKKEFLALKKDDVVYENTEGRVFHKGVVITVAEKNAQTGECTKIYTTLGYLNANSVWIEAFVEERE